MLNDQLRNCLTFFLLVVLISCGGGGGSSYSGPAPAPNSAPYFVDLPTEISVVENQTDLITASAQDDDGDSLTFSSDGWNPYYISLDSQKLGYNSLEYNPADDNAYSFVFRARGVEGTAEIGGVQLIRTLDT